jgi:hypothetical protein
MAKEECCFNSADDAEDDHVHVYILFNER